MMKKLLERFMKKNCRRLINKEFRIDKLVKTKGNKLYVNGQAIIIHLIVALIKRTLYKNESILF